MSTHKKSSRSKSTQTPASATQDIVGLVTTLVERLVSLEAKVDTILSRISTRPFEAPRQQPMPPSSTVRRVDTRPMYKAICADCGKECEVPFRPSADRSVYCKECYIVRRNNSTFKPRQEARPREILPAHRPHYEKPQPAKPAAPVRKKKPAAKKKKRK